MSPNYYLSPQTLISDHFSAFLCETSVNILFSYPIISLVIGDNILILPNICLMFCISCRLMALDAGIRVR